MKLKLITALIALSAMGVSFSGYTVDSNDQNIENWMESRYGENRDNWPIYDTVQPEKATGEQEVVGGEVKDPNHGMHVLERSMGNH